MSTELPKAIFFSSYFPNRARRLERSRRKCPIKFGESIGFFKNHENIAILRIKREIFDVDFTLGFHRSQNGPIKVECYIWIGGDVENLHVMSVSITCHESIHGCVFQ